MTSSGGYALASKFFPGKLQVYFDNFNIGYGFDYTVVATDYTSYAITYSCNNNPLLQRNNDVSFLITRDELEEGTSDYDTMMTKVDAIYAEKLPDFDKAERMFTTKLGTGCIYND